jgi:dTDP-4-dehydrorhamnose 3,5-epimerase
LEDGTEVFYQISEFYAPGLAQGLRYDDPKLEIKWPLALASISDRDQAWALLE